MSETNDNIIKSQVLQNLQQFISEEWNLEEKLKMKNEEKFLIWCNQRKLISRNNVFSCDKFFPLFKL